MPTFKEEWDRCKPWIEAALEYTYGTHTIEDIEDGLAREQFQFWPGKRSAVVTELIQYPRKRALNLFLCGGDITELVEMEKAIEAFAAAIGCNRMIQVGRAGWTKVLKSAGYHVSPMMGAYKDIGNV